MPPDATLAALAGGHARARLAITLDPKDGGPMYQGIVSLEAASIAALIEHYLTASEQIASRLVLGTAGGAARGLLLQRLPSAGPDDEARWSRAAAALATTAEADLFAAVDAAALVAARFPDEDIRLFEAKPTRFACGCSDEKIANALRLLGRAEVESIIAEQGLVGVTCEFCSRRYTFVAADARALFIADVPRDPPGAAGG
jgi:molecular chaperone Hsp33